MGNTATKISRKEGLRRNKDNAKISRNFPKVKIKKPDIVKNICNASKETGWRVWSSSPA